MIIILYFLVVRLGRDFYSTHDQITVKFGDQDISKCLNNLFLVVVRLILAIYIVVHMINNYYAVGRVIFTRRQIR